jgi:translocation and assembly module TamB
VTEPTRLPDPDTPSGANPDMRPDHNPDQQRRRRVRDRIRARIRNRVWGRLVLWCFSGIVLLLVACIAGLAWWMNSENFAQLVHRHLVNALADATGARVEIGAFRWSLGNLEADADNIVLHGNEPAGEAPYARIDHLHAGLSMLGLISPRILLREAIIEHPQIHLIVYPDQTTNQPHPRTQQKSSRSGLDTFFDLKVGHLAVEQGMIDFDNRASYLDVKNRYQPLDFEANDASLILQYVAAHGKTPESYHIDAGVADIDLARGKPRPAPQIHGLLQASLDLTHTAAYLRFARITAHARGFEDHTLQIAGELDDFAHPRWQANITGDLDLRLLDPALGYSDAPEGIAHLNLTSSGHGDQFRIDGPVRVEHASYMGTGVTARDMEVITRVHADNSQLHIADVTIHPKQGGEIGGDVLLLHWLPVTPVAAIVEAAREPEHRRFFSHLGRKQAPQPAPQPASHETLVKAPDTELLVDGKVTANFKSVSIDTIMDYVGQGPFQRLGIDTVFDGPGEATWSHGDVKSLSVHAALNANLPNLTPPGEAPAHGALDATYTQRDGGVELKSLVLTFPATHLEAHGHIGAFPLTSATSLNVDCESRNLAEFDTLLRDLGLNREGRSGTAALPVALHGEGDVHVLWTGSLISPQLTGHVKATQIGIEFPARNPSATEGADAQPHWVSWDEIDADGSYDAERIAIAHSRFRRGASEVEIDGTLTAAATPSLPMQETHPGHHSRGQVGVNQTPEFDANSVLHAHARATKVSLADMLPIIVLDIPATGTLDAQIEADGPLSSPGGSGWAQLTDAVVYDEPISHARAQGSYEHNVLHVSSLTVQSAAGRVNASGSYDLHTERFDAEAHGNNLDLAQAKHLHGLSDTVQGRLSFAATATGTRDDPRIEGHAEATKLMVEGKALGEAQLTAHTVNRALTYDLTSHTDTADLQIHGQTELRGDFPTQAQAQFSHFNLGAALQLAHVQSITAESALAGTATVTGPLRYPERMRGDLRLDQADFTISGVHLHSQGAVHASLADTSVHLEPVHILGDQTDVRVEGTLALKGDHKLDLASDGSVNLKLAETLNKDITADGVTTFQVEGHGTLANPQLRGRVEFADCSLTMEGLPNGLSHVKGTLEFNQNRLEVRSLTAMTGGGQLTLGGYLAYQRGIYADLTVSGKNIRIRYPPGVSSLADSSLRVQGTPSNLAVTGDITITRFSVSPDLDIAALAAQANTAPAIVPSDAPSNRVRLDIRIQSSPQLNFQNAFAKLAGNVDLHLRGTLASPSLLGRISVTQGSAIVAGTHYALQRGEITFSNPLRIQPSLDLNATARVEDYDITLAMRGTPDKLVTTFRSDPPLPESDVVALLTVGRTQSEHGIYTQQQMQSANTTDLLLGGALNATMSSRVQKLFGAGSVKVDPSYLGALGNSTTRITVEEQLGRYVTLTYATSVDTSSQQLLQAEIAINRHVSLVVERDESGVFSMVLKNTRRYR